MTNELQRNVACPACGYNLRGLRGALVQCPECGQLCDVAKLITRGWTKPWYRAPHFNLMAMPAAVVYVGLIAMVIASAAGGAMRSSTPMARMALPAGTGAMLVLLWCYFMYRTWCVFQSVRGPLLALVVHGVVVGYLAGCVALIGGVMALVRAVTQMIDATAAGAARSLAISVMALALGVLLLRVSRWHERFVAGQCIARYLAVEEGGK